VSAANWSHATAYLALRLRANLSGDNLAGTASISGQNVTGIGTNLTSLGPGRWIRFAGLKDRAFQISEILNDLALTLRAEQQDRRVLIKTTTLVVRDFPRLRDLRFQILASAADNAGARELAADITETVYEGGNIELLPPRDFATSLFISWMRKQNELPLGETTPGRHEISLNYIIQGRDY